MRPPTEVWQGCSGYWQSAFIRENFLTLGHAAWQGYLTQGQGMVVCDVVIANVEIVDWQSDIVEHTIRFIPLSNLAAHLQTLNLESTAIEHLLNTVRTYDPAQQILLLMNKNGRIEIGILKQLSVSTTDCYQQMQKRWPEFQLSSPQQSGR